MKSRFRTAIAFLTSPLVAAIGVGLIQATVRPVGEGPSWIEDFWMWTFSSLPTAYILSLLFGTAVFLILRRTAKEYVHCYALVGGGIGAFIGYFLGTFSTSISKRLLACLAFSLLSAAVAFVFAVIRGHARRMA